MPQLGYEMETNDLYRNEDNFVQKLNQLINTFIKHENVLLHFPEENLVILRNYPKTVN